MKRGNFFTKEQALEKTNGGRAIFEKILGTIPNKKIKSPLRPDDDSPSFEIKCKEGVWKFQDYGGNQERGNAIDFLMLIEGISFSQALSKIKEDSFGELLDVVYGEKETPLIEFRDCAFQEKHKKYWDQYELDEKFLRENDVFAVGSWAINKKTIKCEDDRAIFAYYAEDIDRVKILQIGEHVKKEEKWTGNAPSSYLWYFPKEKCDQLWVCKSVKDALCIKKHFGYCVTAVQSENAEILEKNMPKILSISKDIVLNFGSDPQGVKSCKQVQQKWETKYFNTSRYLYEKYKLEDVSDIIAEFGTPYLQKEINKKIKLWSIIT